MSVQPTTMMVPRLTPLRNHLCLCVRGTKLMRTDQDGPTGKLSDPAGNGCKVLHLANGFPVSATARRRIKRDK